MPNMGGLVRQTVMAVAAFMVLSAPSPAQVQPPSSADEAAFGRTYALIIGISHYEYLPQLGTALADAEAVAEVLKTRYDFRVVLLPDAKRDEIVKALNDLRARLTADDNLLIYYAGHGTKDGDEGFWLGVDATSNDETGWVPASDLTRNVREMSARHVLVISDSCYSGLLIERDAYAELITGMDRDALFTRMSSKRSRTVLTSGGLEPVLDGGGSGHSVFAKALLDNLATNTDILDATTLFQYLRATVVKNADQTPEYSIIRKAGDDGGDFLFVPKGHAPVTSLGRAKSEILESALREPAPYRSSADAVQHSAVEFPAFPPEYSNVIGPSFDCSRASNGTEHLLCEDKDLARIDGIMGLTYQKLRNTLPEAGAIELRSQQRQWITQRNQKCGITSVTLGQETQRAIGVRCLSEAITERSFDLIKLLHLAQQ